MKKLLIFNWKMNPQSFSEAKRFFGVYLKTLKVKSLKLKANIIIAPPFVYLSDVRWRQMSDVKLASQDVFYENSGAYTGEISPKMLKNLGVEYVIIGHSERRKYLGETDEMVNKKVLAALKAGLKVVLCVGEPKRESGSRNYELGKAKNYVKKQLEKDLKGLSNVRGQMSNVIVAYEPVWAINTGHSDTPKDAVEMIKFIKKLSVVNCPARGEARFQRQMSNVKVLYGGSVNSKNITEFLKHFEIDGVLIGGASLKAGEVKGIIEITNKIC